MPLAGSLTRGMSLSQLLWRCAYRSLSHVAFELTSGPVPKEKRRCGVLARKVGMMNVWDRTGVRHPITVLCIDRCHVIQVKEPQPSDRRGRWGLQLGAGPKRPYKTNKALRYHFASAGVEPKQTLAEFLVHKDDVLPVGQELRANFFLPGQFVDVTGTSIGKGFQGPMKRWGFKGGGASHGNSKAHRSHGSTGQSTAPGRTFPGKKMAGRMGGDRVTVQSLRVFRIDEPRNLIYVRGAVPGNSGNWVRIRDAVRKPRVSSLSIDVGTTFEKGDSLTESQMLGVRDWESPVVAASL
jgi:large subunit ribosomal protein L3